MNTERFTSAESAARRWLAMVCAVAVGTATLVAPPLTAAAAELDSVPGGPVILDGNDPGDHLGPIDDYLQDVYTNLETNLADPYTHNGEVAVIGTCGGGYLSGVVNSETFVDFDTAAEVEALFADIGDNNYKHIHICSDDDQPSTLPADVQDELDKWGSAIAAHVNRGGGLFSTGHAYNWLDDLFPVIDVTHGGTSESYATPDGADFFPNMAENDKLDAVNHYTFSTSDESNISDSTPLLPLLTAQTDGLGALVAIGGTTVRFPQIFIEGPTTAEVGQDETYTLVAATADGDPLSSNSFTWSITGDTDAAAQDQTDDTDAEGESTWTFTADSASATTVSAVVELGGGSQMGASLTTQWVSHPDAPINVAVADEPDADGAARVSWTAPPDGGRAISDYLIEYSKAGSGTWDAFDDGVSTDPFTVVTGLVDGTDYQLRVAAVNEIGTSDWSDVGEGTPIGTPGEARNVSAHEGDEKVTLTWDAPDSDGGAAITGYAVQYRAGGDDWEDVAADTSGRLTIDSLRNGTRYEFRIAAQNDEGSGPWSTPGTATPHGKASAPNVTVTETGTDTISVSWTAGSGNGLSVTGYEVLVDGKRVATVGSHVRSYEITGLSSGTAFTVGVRARTRAGSGYTRQVSASTDEEKGPSTVDVSGSSTESGDGLTLSWKSDGDDPNVSTKIEITGPGGDETIKIDPGENSYSLGDLEPGVYTITVVVAGEDGDETKTTLTRTVLGGPEHRFQDTVDTTFDDDVAWMKAVGVTKGCNPPDNTRYCPDSIITRAEVAAFLDRYFDPAATDRDAFTDDDGHDFEPELDRTNNARIFRGCNPPANDLVCPDDVITRGELAAVIFRAFGVSEGVGDAFVDTAGHRFQREIGGLAALGITKGCNPPDDDRFCPDDLVTRNEIAAMLRRAASTTG